MIFCCSVGSQYEHFLDRLGEIEESYYQELVENMVKKDLQLIDSLFMYFDEQAGKRCMKLLHMIVLIKRLNHL